MAHKLHVPLDVDFPTDDKVLAAGPLASYLYICSLAFAKRTMSDGKISHTQLLAIAPGLPDASTHAARLVGAGLWVETTKGWRIPAWLKHNPSRKTIEAQSEIAKESGVRGNHLRHHVETGRPSSKCPLCVAEHLAGKTSGTRSGGRSIPDSGAIAKPERREEENREEQRREANKGVSDGFIAFYSQYPVKKGKGQAEKAYRTAVKAVSHDTIMAGLSRLLPELQEAKTRDKCKHPSTWLNGCCWEDESTPLRVVPLITGTVASTRAATDAYLDDLARRPQQPLALTETTAS